MYFSYFKHLYRSFKFSNFISKYIELFLVRQKYLKENKHKKYHALTTQQKNTKSKATIETLENCFKLYQADVNDVVVFLFSFLFLVFLLLILNK